VPNKRVYSSIWHPRVYHIFYEKELCKIVK
jgi:hypothetical protein